MKKVFVDIAKLFWAKVIRKKDVFLTIFIKRHIHRLFNKNKAHFFSFWEGKAIKITRLRIKNFQ